MTTPLPHHRSDGASGAPALLLGPSLGTSLALWDAQADALARDFHVVRWDLPGHGGSSADLITTGATVADLGRLVLDLADALGLDRFAYAGNPQDIIRQVEKLIEAGASRVEFGTPHGLNSPEGIRLLGEKVLPYFAS